MKKYKTLGELLLDYRDFNNLSQSDLSAKLDVDVRTIIRWERDETLLKPEKEKELVMETFIPYQVIRNLNAAVPIPTFYDFNIRKYSLAAIANSFPEAEWFKQFIDASTSRIRTIVKLSDADEISRYTNEKYTDDNLISPHLILESAKMLPDLNLVLIDTSGFYAGHCVILPLKMETYQKLKKREITVGQIRTIDLVNFKNADVPIFYEYNITADCNTNMFYLVGAAFKFFRDQLSGDYIFATLTTRYDNKEFDNQIGLKVIWEDKEEQAQLGLSMPPRFYEGNFNAFLKD